MKYLRMTAIATMVGALCGCGESGRSGCPETGDYACMTGAESKETLYTYQWALNSLNSYFKDFPSVSDGATDLKVEAVHKQGIKGNGVNVLVIDEGLVLNHEDLNVNSTMTWNFDTNSADPTPTQDANNLELAHGMNVAGIIAALQNGKGVMGIAPKVTLGGVRAISLPKGKEDSVNWIDAYGGASWSKAAHIINASYGGGPIAPPDFDTATSDGTAAIRAFPALRGGKGLIMVKAAGNEFMQITDDGKPLRRECPKYRPPGTTNNMDLASCETPANDTEALEPGVILVASANALGKRAVYSSAGSVMWVTGLGGEWGTSGKFGEATGYGTDGPHLYSTDLPGCTYGYSRDATTLATDFLKQGTVTNKEKNPNCDYSHMNGTSAATPTVSGVIALILEANPNLTWRDVRDILRSTARQIDTKYDEDANRNKRVDLAATLGTYTADRSTDTTAPDGYLLTLTTESTSTLSDGDTSARRELGWQTNAAGFKYSNWYGFGLIDATEAVAKAKTYTAYKPSLLVLPGFKTILKPGTIDTEGVFAVKYGQVTRLATFTVTDNRKVDALQLRLSSSTSDLCIGSVGIYVKSPSGTVSILSTPYNSYYSNNAKLFSNSNYGLGSYAFYGESANANGGVWEIFSVSGKPQIKCSPAISGNISIQYRIVPMEL